MELKLLCAVIFLLPLAALTSETKIEKATFAGGCFWCMEAPFEQLAGVMKVTAGYTGGNTKNPTYNDVSSGKTGHYEAVQITYDPNQINYEKLLEVFWQQIDPTDSDGQFVDQGTQYRTVIFYHSEEQKKLALQSKDALNKSGKFNQPVITAILQAVQFYPAEDYHQDYYIKFADNYYYYKSNSGRDQFLEKIWGKKTKAAQTNNNGYNNYKKPVKQEIKKILNPLQYKVTQENGTERAFDNEYWDKKNDGIYVDLLSGEPLFSSLDKYDSGTGWPSFTKPLEPDNIVEKKDRSFFSERTEVRSKYADSHLGHVFDDGPQPSGLRYCMNSAALKFISKADLEKTGYGKYMKLFSGQN